MAVFSSSYKFAVLDRPENCGAGYVKGENYTRNIPANNFVGKKGVVIELDDTGYDTDRPTGDEPVLYLVDFDGQKVWVESEALKLSRV